jgi:hypothetical protein
MREVRNAESKINAMISTAGNITAMPIMRLPILEPRFKAWESPR